MGSATFLLVFIRLTRTTKKARRGLYAARAQRRPSRRALTP
jgi:hypothetical protein